MQEGTKEQHRDTNKNTEAKASIKDNKEYACIVAMLKMGVFEDAMNTIGKAAEMREERNEKRERKIRSTC